jgi:hypothetical protein
MRPLVAQLPWGEGFGLGLLVALVFMLDQPAIQRPKFSFTGAYREGGGGDATSQVTDEELIE